MYNKLLEIERELNETHNLKKMFPEFPINVKIPKVRFFRNSLCLLYQKNKGFVVWAPNHFTRASLVTSFTPFLVSATADPNIRSSVGSAGDAGFWNVRLGDGVGVTNKGDTSLKATTSYQADSGTCARVDTSGGYQRQISAIYNAGTLPNNYPIREVGLFLKALLTTSISGQNFSIGTEYMISRFSTSDGDFSVYNVNNTLPLTINLVYQWTLG